MERINVKIITKTPPHGRCKMFTSIVWLLIHYYKNAAINIIPEIYKNSDDPDAPNFIVNGKIIEPSNTIYVSGEDIINAMNEAGAEPYEEVKPDAAKFDEIIEKCLS
jgi:hypothetical protein